MRTECAPRSIGKQPVWLLIVLVSCGAIAWTQQTKLTADQIESVLAGAQTDAQTAHALAAVEPTERLSDQVRSRFLEKAPGPRTRDVLEIIADASLFLDSIASVQPPSEEADLLTRAREHTIRYLESLPNFLCTRATRRFDDYPDPPGRAEVWRGLRFRDSSVGQLSVQQGQESYIDETAGSENDAHGVSSFGELGSIIGSIFIGGSRPEIEWGYWDRFGDRRLAVFRYSIPAARSRYSVSYCCDRPKGPVSLLTAYRGEFWVDPVSGGIWRVTRETMGLPSGFPTHWVRTVVDYGSVRIGSASYLLPVRSTTMSESTLQNTPRGTRKIRYWNEIRFLRHHRFGVESRILTGEENATPPPPGEIVAADSEPWLELDVSDNPAPAARNVPVAPSERPTIRISTQLIEVPVIVKDKRGVPVLGLHAEDFALLDNGVPRPVQLFPGETSAGGAPLADQRPDVQLFGNSIPDRKRGENSTVILLDFLNTSWADLAYARAEVSKFIQHLPAADRRIGLYQMVAGGIVVLSELGSDPADVVKALSSALSESKPAELLGSAASDCGGLAEMSLLALRSAARHMATLPGRKSLVWVTAGFALQSCLTSLRTTIEEVNRANVGVYAVDAPGLQTAFADASVSAPKNSNAGASHTYSFAFAIHANQSSMLELAAGTGGRAFLNANDIAGAARAAYDDAIGSYVLGFYAGQEVEARYHSLQVRVIDRPDLRVRYRAGYSTGPVANSRHSVEEALNSPTDFAGIHMTAELSRTARRCDLLLKVRLSDIALKQMDDHWTGKLQISVLQQKNHARALNQNFGLHLSKETYDRMMREGFLYHYSFVPEPGTTLIRVVAFDRESGALGSVSIPGHACQR